MKRLGIIDIGTNTVRYLVCAYTQAGIDVLAAGGKTTRLGEAGVGSQSISPAVLKRTLDYLHEVINHIQQQWHAPCKGFATEAVRQAANQDAVTEAFSAAFQPQGSFTVLTSKEEAMLSGLGVVKGLHITGPGLIGDIGGGSSEIIYYDGYVFCPWETFPIGAVVLKEFFGKQSGTAVCMEHIVEQACAYVKSVCCSSLLIKNHEHIPLYVCGGTATTLASIYLQLEQYDSMRINGTQLTINFLHDFIQRSVNRTPQQLLSIKGLSPDRSDIIVGGAIILKTLMEMLQIPFMTVSHHGLLWGLAHKEQCSFYTEEEN